MIFPIRLARRRAMSQTTAKSFKVPTYNEYVSVPPYLHAPRATRQCLWISALICVISCHRLRTFADQTMSARSSSHADPATVKLLLTQQTLAKSFKGIWERILYHTWSGTVGICTEESTVSNIAEVAELCWLGSPEAMPTAHKLERCIGCFCCPVGLTTCFCDEVIKLCPPF